MGVKRPSQSEGCNGYYGANGTDKGIVMVKNQQEWEESRKALKERKKRRTNDGRTSDEPDEFGLPMGDFKEQISQLLDAVRRKTQERR
jgi:hypothetical protein